MLVSGKIEPVIPGNSDLVSLLELASDLRSACDKLLPQVGREARVTLKTLLRAMNSYYTNKIEGQHTYPADLEDALKSKFSVVSEIKRKQQLAIAHMQVEAEFEILCKSESWAHLFSPAWIHQIHQCLYSKLDPESLHIYDENGQLRETMVPGQIRAGWVKVGAHTAPAPEEVPELLEHFHFRYKENRSETMKLIAAGCAMHRLSWIHPYPDGNGRVSRLQNHLVLSHMGLTEGLWSPMRGLARRQTDYYQALHQADLGRLNASDGRGNLSAKGLSDYVKFWLEISLDQVRFMSEMLSLESIKERYVSLALQFLFDYGQGAILHHRSIVKPELLGGALYELFKHGRLERGTFKAIINCSERTASRVLSKLIDQGLVVSPSRVGHLEPGFPFFCLRFLFPGLWPEAESIVRPPQAMR